MNKQEPIIRCFNVSKWYENLCALKKINLDICTGEFVFITGPSGAGKSTLLKILYLDETASEGQIVVDGMNLARISKARMPYLRRRLGVVFQDFKLIPNRTVYENVALVLEVAGVKKSLIRQKVLQVLRITGMTRKIHALPPTLSGGEQQRVAFARAVVGEPAIIIADEPTGSLDHDSARIIFNLLVKYNDKGVTILIASHNLHLINNTNRGRHIHLTNGELQLM
ncbi:cell division ATP-binding protein FtsE [Desulfamplus magnetovallimortis]|nr:ATP-binding cassette domain-containing protein [Desulfamplus magnetovallimortis]